MYALSTLGCNTGRGLEQICSRQSDRCIFAQHLCRSSAVTSGLCVHMSGWMFVCAGDSKLMPCTSDLLPAPVLALELRKEEEEKQVCKQYLGGWARVRAYARGQSIQGQGGRRGRRRPGAVIWVGQGRGKCQGRGTAGAGANAGAATCTDVGQAWDRHRLTAEVGAQRVQGGGWGQGRGRARAMRTCG